MVCAETIDVAAIVVMTTRPKRGVLWIEFARMGSFADNAA
jgi:hypothetical protein